MLRDDRAYLADIAEACRAIVSLSADIDLPAYLASRLHRSAMEREFIIIGEALGRLAKEDPDTFARITSARRIVDFRNRLAHEYASIDDRVVWAIADHDVAVLLRECDDLLLESEKD